MLITERDGGVATLVLDRPERGNALDHELVESLIGEVRRLCGDDAIHTIVLRGSGRHFCTGLDLSDLGQVSDGDLLARLVRIETLLAMLWHAPVRTVCVAQGRTWGAGADLFVACEQRIALPGSTFRFPGARFGIVLGTRRLAERVGTERARELTIDARELDAPAALAWGLASGGVETPLAAPRVTPGTAAALRSASRQDHRDADLAALVRSAAEPGLRERVAAYRSALVSGSGTGSSPASGDAPTAAGAASQALPQKPTA